jgi:hypothetical protein
VKVFAAGAVVAVGAALMAGASRWNAGTRDIRARLEAARVPVEPSAVDLKTLDTLPAPVARMLRTVLTEGQPMIAGARVRHRGTFNMGEAADNWRPFTSDQRVVTRRPGFDWDARISMFPGIAARVHDAYVAGEGILFASLFGLIPVMDATGGPGVAEGELMRFFAETAWYPTALMPGQGVTWSPVDDRSADGTLTDGDLRITLRFTFGDEGFIERVRAVSRGRTVGDRVVPTPWEGQFWDYAVQDGMRIPLEGEVSWILPEGAKPYWRGRIEHAEYEWAR